MNQKNRTTTYPKNKLTKKNLIKKMHVMHSFDPYWVYTLNKDLEAIAHGFSGGLVQKVGYHEVL